MNYKGADVFAATAATDNYRGGKGGEVGAALVVVGLNAERPPRKRAFATT
jgi:hypothetical protein